MYTILKLWEHNGYKSGFWIKSPTNKTKFKLLQVIRGKNIAIVMSRGKRLNFFKKYYTIYVIDNARWDMI